MPLLLSFQIATVRLPPEPREAFDRSTSPSDVSVMTDEPGSSASTVEYCAAHR